MKVVVSKDQILDLTQEQADRIAELTEAGYAFFNVLQKGGTDEMAYSAGTNQDVIMMIAQYLANVSDVPVYCPHITYDHVDIHDPQANKGKIQDYVYPQVEITYDDEDRCYVWQDAWGYGSAYKPLTVEGRLA